jgi:hypothetical protein
VALLLEEAQEQAAQLVGGFDVHGNYLLFLRDGGLGIRDRTQPPITNPQSPIPNPQNYIQ